MGSVGGRLAQLVRAPALLRYFDKAPEKLYVKGESNPHWNVNNLLFRLHFVAKGLPGIPSTVSPVMSRLLTVRRRG